MSTREELIYAQMVAEDQRKTAELRAVDPKAASIVTEPIDKVFFFPTEADVKIARKWQERGIVTPNNYGTLRFALDMVSKRIAVPLHYLRLVRSLKKD